MAWRSGQSYSGDLRERVLAAVDGGVGAYAAAPLFRVSVSYIYKALARRRRTGEAEARPRSGRPAVGARHAGARPGLVEEDQARSVEARHHPVPGGAGLGHVRPVLLGGP